MKQVYELKVIQIVRNATGKLIDSDEFSVGIYSAYDIAEEVAQNLMTQIPTFEAYSIEQRELYDTPVISQRMQNAITVIKGLRDLN